MATFISHSVDETRSFGERWGRMAVPRSIIGLSGDLGAGKTQFVIGLASGLGITGRVQSPTFALVHEYSGGRVPLVHLDLYRLDTPEQIIGAGLEDYFYHPDGVVVVEWCERWPGFADRTSEPSGLRSKNAPGRVSIPQFLRVQIEPLDEGTRRITYDDPGP